MAIVEQRVAETVTAGSRVRGVHNTVREPPEGFRLHFTMDLFGVSDPVAKPFI